VHFYLSFDEKNGVITPREFNYGNTTSLLIKNSVLLPERLADAKSKHLFAPSALTRGEILRSVIKPQLKKEKTFFSYSLRLTCI
jgi:hypothetical protein